MLSFFSTRYVKQKLRAHELSETRLFAYFYLLTLYDTSALLQNLLLGNHEAKYIAIEAYGFFFLTAFGVLVVFFANGASKGTRFLEKYFPLAFTVGYKYGILLLLVEYLLSLFGVDPMISLYAFFSINTVMVANIAWQVRSLNR